VIEVERYLQSHDIFTPFFFVVGDADYVSVKDKLSAKGLDIVALSDYCRTPDRQPNLDDFYNRLGVNGNKVIVGFGEYLSLCGTEKAYDELVKLQDLRLTDAKVVLLLRGVESTIRTLQGNDIRFDTKRVFFADNTVTRLTLTCVSEEVDFLTVRQGLKGILAAFESGQITVVAKTKQKYDNPTISVTTIESAYDGVRLYIPTLGLPKSIGDEANWNALFTELSTSNGNLEAVFIKHNLSDSLLNEFTYFIQKVDFSAWLYFIALKLKSKNVDNSYLRFVLDRTYSFNLFKHNILYAIIDVPHTDSRFDKFYDERKTLIEKFSEYELTDFINNNSKNIEESLFKLTDMKQSEREEFIALFGKLDKQLLMDRIKTAYQLLSDYLCPYIFTDSKLSISVRKTLTKYFNDYKWQKILNNIDKKFVAWVEHLAKHRQYPLLPSRSDVISNINRDGTMLYWLDALGIEYLGFIQAVCNRMDLSLSIHIGRAELPTLTYLNKDFYDNWDSDWRITDKRLDEIKHKASGGYNYSAKNKAPVHLARELEVIFDVLEKIANLLYDRKKYKKILLVSDHGASRLAVRNEQEEKYETDTKGEHGGRCCKVFLTDDLPPFATVENDYLVLANYGRFKGSRTANVEVHGGATLEEVAVPIIEITLANQDVSIELVNETVYADYRTEAIITLFSNTKLENVSIYVKEKKKPYAAERTDDNHYKVETDIKRAGEYNADVFSGDDLIGKVKFIAQGGIGKKNADVANFFK
jgi:hypothetical protein